LLQIIGWLLCLNIVVKAMEMQGDPKFRDEGASWLITQRRRLLSHGQAELPLLLGFSTPGNN